MSEGVSEGHERGADAEEGAGVEEAEALGEGVGEQAEALHEGAGVEAEVLLEGAAEEAEAGLGEAAAVAVDKGVAAGHGGRRQVEWEGEQAADA